MTEEKSRDRQWRAGYRERRAHKSRTDMRKGARSGDLLSVYVTRRSYREPISSSDEKERAFSFRLMHMHIYARHTREAKRPDERSPLSWHIIDSLSRISLVSLACGAVAWISKKKN